MVGGLSGLLCLLPSFSEALPPGAFNEFGPRGYVVKSRLHLELG